MDPLDLNSFLKLGYFLSYAGDARPVDLAGADPALHAGVPEAELVRRSAALLRRLVERMTPAGARHVVPLSGGLDSRALLAVLRQGVEASRIETYTFGTPGTLDYELGRAVARRAGVRHTELPLTEQRYTLDEMLDVSRRVGGQTFLFHHPPVWRVDEAFGGATVWSGYIGDLFAGSYLRPHPAATAEEAKRWSFGHDRYVRSMELGSLPDEAVIARMDPPPAPRERVTFEEQLTFVNRVRKNTAPHVLMEGYDYRTPFVEPEWARFWLSLAPAHRLGLRLWKRMLPTLDRALFALPAKSHFGMPLTASRARVAGVRALRKAGRAARRVLGRPQADRYLNYLDFNEAFRERADLRELARASLADLRARGLVDWLDPEDVYRRHQARQGQHADALIVLTSLEIHHKAREAAAAPAAGADTTHRIATHR